MFLFSNSLEVSHTAQSEGSLSGSDISPQKSTNCDPSDDNNSSKQTDEQRDSESEAAVDSRKTKTANPEYTCIRTRSGRLSGTAENKNILFHKRRKSQENSSGAEEDPDVEDLEQMALNSLTSENTVVSESSETGLGLKEVVEECMKDDPKLSKLIVLLTNYG